MSGAGARALVVVCAWSDGEPPAHLLGPRERGHASGLRGARRREWIRARLTAKAAFFWLGGYRGVQIGYDDAGAPVPEPPAGLVGGGPAAVSLAHCGDVTACAAALGGAAVGVDVERVDARNDILLGRLLRPGERSPFRSDRPGAASTLLFACKESALKACRGRSPAPRDYRVRLTAGGLRVCGPHPRRLCMWTALADDTAAAFCWDRPEPPRWHHASHTEVLAAAGAQDDARTHP